MEELVLFVDGYDVLLTPAVRDLPRLFGEHFNGARVVFSSEHSCWPDAAVCHAAAQATASSSGTAEFGRTTNLNSGVFVGSATDLLTMLREISSSYGAFAMCGDDQRSYWRYYLDHPDFVALDTDSVMFQSMHGFSWDVELEEEGEGTTQPVLRMVDQTADARYVRTSVTTPPNHPRRCGVLHFNSADGKTMFKTMAEGMGLAEQEEDGLGSPSTSSQDHPGADAHGRLVAVLQSMSAAEGHAVTFWSDAESKLQDAIVAAGENGLAHWRRWVNVTHGFDGEVFDARAAYTYLEVARSSPRWATRYAGATRDYTYGDAPTVSELLPEAFNSDAVFRGVSPDGNRILQPTYQTKTRHQRTSAPPLTALPPACTTNPSDGRVTRQSCTPIRG
jgi:hypothetical protein